MLNSKLNYMNKVVLIIRSDKYFSSIQLPYKVYPISNA